MWYTYFSILIFLASVVVISKGNASMWCRFWIVLGISGRECRLPWNICSDFYSFVFILNTSNNMPHLWFKPELWSTKYLDLSSFITKYVNITAAKLATNTQTITGLFTISSLFYLFLWVVVLQINLILLIKCDFIY